MEGQSLKDCFTKTALNKGNKIAIRFLRRGVIETEISYLELNQDSNRLANFFIDQGIEKGDRVVLYLPKSVFLVVAHLALQKIGAMAVPLNPGFKKSEMAYLLGDVDAKLVIAGTLQNSTVTQIDPRLKTIVINSETPYGALDFFRSAPDEIPEVSIEQTDPGLIVYTSGTTGKPKGAILTQRNLVHDAANVIKIWEIAETDVLCHALPLFHVHGLCFALHTALLAGSQVVMLDDFSPQRVVETLANNTKNPCTMFMAVPAMYNKLMDYLAEKKMNFDHIRLFTSGSAPLLSKDFERIKRIFGKEPVEREGMSETGMNFSNPLKGIKKPGSIGIPLPDLEVRIVDLDTFKDVNPGQEGEIWLKGPAVTPGYWRKPTETQKAFEAGWFRTGDLGRIDDDGYYYLTDRIKHIIISGGENISPKEIEGVINQLDQVVESSVVGIADDKWGEKVVVAVVPKTDATIKCEDIQSYCKQHLHGWKCPKEVVFVDALPKNTMGKVLKEDVKALFRS
jgi:malonyl-CoA/methylmalonyl-CoA synthetase